MLGGVSFHSTLAIVFLPGHTSCHTEKVNTVVHRALSPTALGRYVTTVPTFPVWHLGPGNN